jgi:hypothetical protein
MVVLFMLSATLCFLLMAAHCLRAGNLVLVMMSLAMMGLLWIRRPWMRMAVQMLLALAALEWVRTTYLLAQTRMEEQEPWIRAAVILLAVAAFNLMAAGLLQLQSVRKRYEAGRA